MIIEYQIHATVLHHSRPAFSLQFRIIFSSPLEAHKSHQICFGMTGIDVGFENPVFASIEQSYEAADKSKPKEDEPQPFIRPPKGISFWEMDLGLNHVIKKVSVLGQWFWTGVERRLIIDLDH